MPNLPPIDDQEVKNILFFREEERRRRDIQNTTALIGNTRDALGYIAKEIALTQKRLGNKKPSNIFRVFYLKLKKRGITLAVMVFGFVAASLASTNIILTTRNVIHHDIDWLIVFLRFATTAFYIHMLRKLIRSRKELYRTDTTRLHHLRLAQDIYQEDLNNHERNLALLLQYQLPELEDETDDRQEPLVQPQPVDLDLEVANIIQRIPPEMVTKMVNPHPLFSRWCGPK